MGGTDAGKVFQHAVKGYFTPNKDVVETYMWALIVLYHTIWALQVRGLGYFWFILCITVIICKKPALNAIVISCMQTNRQQQKQQKDKIGNSFSMWQPWNCREN